MPILQTLWRKIIWPEGTAQRAARVVLGLLLAACLTNMWLAPDPVKAGVGPRIAAGKKPMVKHYVATYNWYMAAANAVLLGGLLLSIPLWVRPTVALEERAPEEPAPPRLGTIRPDAFTWITLAGAVMVFLYFAGPRLDLSLWGDEEFTFRRHFFGEYRRDVPSDPGSPLKLQKVSWLDTVYGYKEPNNHIFQTILSRLCHEVWLKAVWAHDTCKPQVGEAALRLPPFIAALATFPALVALGSIIGRVRVGALAALLLAFHPWFQRYGSEARGYSFLILFTVLGILLLILGMRTGKWRWWILYGLCQFLLMWSYVGGLFVPVALNAFAAGWLLLRGRAQPAWFWSTATRWFVVNLLSGMMFFQMMLPCIPMLQDYLEKGSGVPEHMDKTWFLHVGGHMLGGMEWVNTYGHDEPLYQSWQGEAALHPVGFWFAIIGTAGLALLGLGILAFDRRRRPGDNPVTRWLLLTWILIPIGMALAHGQITQHYYYIWYLIFALPCYALAWAIAVERIGVWLSALARQPQVVGIGLATVAGLAMILPVIMDRLVVQRNNSIEPLKESALLMHEPGVCYPYDKANVISAGFVMPTPAYDPAYIRLNTGQDLRNLVAYARANNRPLRVAYGAQELSRARLPDLMAELEGSGNFHETLVMPATWPFVTRHLMELNPVPKP